jgi:hypothetical protein
LLGEDDSVAGRLQVVCTRYARIIEGVMPTFSRGEWCALLNGNSRVGVTADWPALWTNLSDNAPTLSEKWNVDVADFASRLQDLPVPQLAAVAEAVDRFWSDAYDLPLDAALAKVGARISE